MGYVSFREGRPKNSGKGFRIVFWKIIQGLRAILALDSLNFLAILALDSLTFHYHLWGDQPAEKVAINCIGDMIETNLESNGCSTNG